MQHTLKGKIGQRLIVGFSGTEFSNELKEAINTYKIGNIVLFKENITNREQIKSLCTEIREFVTEETGYPPFITIDQEGGVVTRLSDDCVNIPSAMAVAATGDPHNAYLAGLITGQELNELGINFNLAPCVDINSNPNNPVIGVRSYGDTPNLVSTFALEMMRGLTDGSVLCCAKHFPGHGDTSVDSHLGLPIVTKTLDELDLTELLPYRNAIIAGIPAIMTTHILFPKLDPIKNPATMSKTILQNILRQKMGFKGLILSDCMQMKAISDTFGTEKGVLAALKAGVDLCFISHDTKLACKVATNIEAAVNSGLLATDNIDESYERIIHSKQQLGQFPAKVYTSKDSLALVDEMLLKSITEVNYAPFTLGLTPLCVGCLPYRTALIGNVIDQTATSFPAEIAPLLNGTPMVIAVDPSPREIATVVEHAKRHSSMVVGTYNGHIQKGQIDLVKALVTLNKPVAVIAQRNPYDLSSLPPNVLTYAVYEYSKRAISIVAQILLGKTKAEGKLPVRL